MGMLSRKDSTWQERVGFGRHLMRARLASFVEVYFRCTEVHLL